MLHLSLSLARVNYFQRHQNKGGFGDCENEIPCFVRCLGDEPG